MRIVQALSGIILVIETKEAMQKNNLVLVY